MPTYVSNNCAVFALSANTLGCTTCKSGYKLNTGSCVVLDSYLVGCN
jgi:hypothetical protein